MLLSALVVGGGWLYLRSDAGSARLKGLISEQAGAALQGKLELGEVRVAGRTWVLTGVKLYDPDGKLVAELERLEASPRIADLLRSRIELERVRLVRPRLYLVQDERGLNLTRALAAREKGEATPSSSSGGSSPLTVVVDALSLEEGFVDYVDAERRYTLEGLSAQGRARHGGPSDALEAKLVLAGRAVRPLPGPVEVTLQAQGENGALAATVAASLPGARLSTQLERRGTEYDRVELKDLELSPEAVSAFAPKSPLRAAVRATGRMERKGNRASLELAATAASARLDVSGSLDIARLRSDGITVKARGVNLAELIEGGLPSDLALTLEARGGGTRLQDLDGAVRLEVPHARLGGQPFGPVRVSASAEHGQFTLSELSAALPGTTLSARGGGTAQEIRASGTLTAADLSATARALRALGVDAQGLAGSGTLALSVHGPLTHPGLSVKGRLSSLRVASAAIQGLSIDARLPDVRRPLEADGKLAARVVRLAERELRDLSAAVVTRGRQLSADFSIRGLAELVLHVGGKLDAGGESLLVEAFELQYPEAHWRLAAPARLTWSDGDVSAEPIRLSAGGQAIAVAGAKRGERIDASVELTAVDLARLPRVLTVPELGLGGRLSGSMNASGRLSRPQAKVKLRWQDGRLTQLSGISLSLDAETRAKRVSGSLRATSSAGAASGTFDLPLGWTAQGREAIALELKLEEIDLAQAMRVSSVRTTRSALAGTLSAELRLSGTPHTPRLDLNARARDVLWQRPDAPAIALGETELDARTAEDGALGARLSISAFSGTGSLTLETPLTLARLIEAPPDLPALQRTPLTASLQLTGLDLARVAAAGVGPTELAGKLDLRVDARGTALAPEGTARLQILGATLPGAPPLDVALDAEAAARELIAQLQLRRDTAPLVKLDARLEAPLAQASDLGALARAPFSLRADLGPVPLSELSALRGTVEEEPATPLEGVLEAHLAGSGTLEDPQLSLRATLDRLGLSKAALGKAIVQYAYRKAENTVTLDLASAGGGTLKLSGRAELGLSYSAVKRGLNVRTAPFEVNLSADRLDLAFLSGLHPEVRLLAGRLSASGQARGTLDRPDLRGKVEWSEGRVGLLGYGEYRRVHLLAEATLDRIELKDLSASSGGGSLRVQGAAQRTPGGFGLSGSAVAQHFPLISDDQLVAIATLNTTWQGQMSESLIDIRELAIPEAHLELPELKRKDLQDLSRPSDVVLVRNGKPLGARKARASTSAAGGAPSGDTEPARARPSGRAFQIAVNAPRNLWVRSSDVNLELGLSEDFLVAYADALSIRGEVAVREGRADVLGRRLDLDEGSRIRFNGPPKLPYVNLAATHVNEREGVTVTVTITGRGKDVVIKVSSQPPLPESEIYTLLATGRRTLKRGSGASMTGSQAASVVGSLFASQLKSALAKKLPLDVLSIEAGEAGLSGAKVEAGTYLSKDLYVGYSGRIGADASKGENSHEVKLEYQLAPQVGVELKYGDAGAGGADMVWIREY